MTQVERPDVASEETVASLHQRLDRERALRKSYEEALAKQVARLGQVEEKLRKETRRSRALSAAVETAREGIALLNGREHFVYTNRAYEALFGFPHRALIGTSWRDLYDDATASTFDRVVRPLLHQHGVWQGEAVARTADGRTVQQEVLLTQIGTGGAICTTRDISDRKRRDAKVREMESRLRAAEHEAAVAVVGHAVAHDFNNVIAVISSYARLIEEDLLDDPENRRRAQRILQAAGQATQVVQALQSDPSGEAPALGICDLSHLVRTAVDIMEAMRPAGVTVHTDILPGLQVRTDDVLLSRCILNVVKNGYEALGDKGILKVRLARKPDRPFTQDGEALIVGDPDPAPGAILEITDTGAGIPPDRLGQIFDPFYTTKPRRGGAGLGLGLQSLKLLTDTTGAALRVESVPQEGTRVSILFKADDPIIPWNGALTEADPADHSTHNEDETTAEATPTSSVTIFLVDDDPMVGEPLAETLRRLGYWATWFQHPEDALSELRSEPDQADLLLTDYSMPRLTGDRLAKKVRAACPTLPIILYSGQAGYLPRDPLFAAILRKPLSPEDLKRAIDAALG